MRRTTPLKEVIELGRQCQRKGECCKRGSGFLVGEDLANIARFLKISEDKIKEKYLAEVELFNTKLFRPKIIHKKKLFGILTKKLPFGKCIFYDSKSKDCRIHGVKPLQCKIATCGEIGEKLSLWFMLNYQVNLTDPESIRQYATYLKCGGKTLDDGKLNDLVSDKKILKKILNYEVLR